MKKIFTFVLAAALAAPVFAAKVDVKCYQSSTAATVGGVSSVFSPNEEVYLGTYSNQSISYDAANDCYNLDNFIGYDKANFSFKIKEFKAPFDESRIAIEFITPYGSLKEPELSERTSIAYDLGSPNYKVGFYLNPDRGLTQSSDGSGDRDNPIYRSGEFTGEGNGFALAQPDLAANGSAANNYYTTRTYAVKDGNKYKINIRTTVMSSWKKENSEWVYDDDTYYRKSLYLCFEITDKLEGMEEGGDTPSGIDVTVDTYDDKVVTKVAESFTSKFSCDANGVYTLAGVYGSPTDVQFKIGAYDSANDQYAIEFQHVKIESGYVNYPYILNRENGYASFYPVAANGSDIPDYITYVMATQSLSYIYKENGYYCAAINWSGSKGDTYNYTDYYYMFFSWPEDLGAGVEGVVVDNENAPVEYYNLQGVRVENPSAGLYIKRQGNKVEKVVIR